MKTKRTPLKDRPLRQAGQSLREERDKLLEDRLLPWVLAAVMFSAFALNEWLRYWQQSPPQPWLLTAPAVVVTAFAMWRFYSPLPEARRLRLAIDGETVVGQYLERLHAEGYQVFHDIIGDSSNIDHALVGPSGIYTIETKTWNKPRSDSRVVFDGENIHIAGLKLDRNPVRQAKSQAAWLRSTIKESTGREFEVRPVIVFPGWFVEAERAAHKEMWVLEPKALPDFLASEPVRLDESARKLVCFHLSRLIRSTAKN